MSDKKRQRRGAFSPPEDPFDLAPLPVGNPSEGVPSPPPVRAPPPQEPLRPLPVIEDEEDATDEPTEPTPGPITMRSGGLRVHTLKVAVSTSNAPSNDLAALVEVNTAGETPRYEPPPIRDDDVSVYDDGKRADALLDQDTDEQALPTQDTDPDHDSPLVVHDRVHPTNFTDTHDKDATVFKDDNTKAPRPFPVPHAWWERGTAGSSPPQPAEHRQLWPSPEGLVEDAPERSTRFDQWGAIALVAALVLVALYAYVHRPSNDPGPVTDAEVPSPVLENLKNLRDDAELATEEESDDPDLEPEAFEVHAEEPAALVEAVEPDEVTEEAEEAEEAEEPVPPERPEVVEATEELEELAREAIYDVGILVVTTTGQPALVYVDGEPIGYTPIRGMELEPGTHLIKAVIPGRTPKTQSVRVDPGGAHQLSFSF